MKKYMMIFFTMIIAIIMIGCSAEQNTVVQQKDNKLQQSQSNLDGKVFSGDEIVGYMEMGYYNQTYESGFHKMGINLKGNNPILFTDLLKKGGFTFISDYYSQDRDAMKQYSKLNKGDTSASALYYIFATGPNKEEVQFRFLYVSKLQFDDEHNQFITYEIQMLNPILNNGKMTDKLYKSWKVLNVIPTKSYSQSELEDRNKSIKDQKEKNERETKEQKELTKKYEDLRDKQTRIKIKFGMLVEPIEQLENIDPDKFDAANFKGTYSKVTY